MNRLVNTLSNQKQKGFTFVEMITTVLLVGIMSGITVVFIKSVGDTFVDTKTRSKLLDDNEVALRNIVWDVENALPNSIRISQEAGGSPEKWYLELVPLEDSLIYDASTTFTSALSQIDLLYQVRSGVCDTAGCRAVINNTTAAGAGNNIYETGGVDGDVITDTGTTVAIANDGSGNTRHRITFSPAFDFNDAGSAFNRVDLVKQAVTYKCDLSSRTLEKYWGYDITQNQPIDDASAPLSTANTAVLAENVDACYFEYIEPVPSTGYTPVGVSGEGMGFVVIVVKFKEEDKDSQVVTYRQVAVRNNNWNQHANNVARRGQIYRRTPPV